MSKRKSKCKRCWSQAERFSGEWRYSCCCAVTKQHRTVRRQYKPSANSNNRWRSNRKSLERKFPRRSLTNEKTDREFDTRMLKHLSVRFVESFEAREWKQEWVEQTNQRWPVQWWWSREIDVSSPSRRTRTPWRCCPSVQYRWWMVSSRDRSYTSMYRAVVPVRLMYTMLWWFRWGTWPGCLPRRRQE